MRRGLTLIELLIVFGIIGLTVGTAVLYLRTSSAHNVLASAAQQLVADLRLAASLSASTQINHELLLNPQTRTYQVLALGSPIRLIKTVRLPSGVNISATTLSGNQTQFNSLGAALTSGTITLRHQNGTLITIDLRPSGYAHILQ